jgi:hypothetical protein
VKKKYLLFYALILLTTNISFSQTVEKRITYINHGINSNSTKSLTICDGGTTTWTEDITHVDKIRVCSGSTLIIQSKVEFLEDGMVVIEPGGKLKVDGGELTSPENMAWHGVQVLGDPESAQNPALQGWVHITNNSVISNSEWGVYAYKMIYDEIQGENGGIYEPGYEGGIIQAGNSSFINNQRAVQFEDYETYSVSYFTNCEFITDTNYLISTFPSYFMRFSGMNSIDITNCDFINDTDSLYLHKGIYSYDSDINVDGFYDETEEEWDYGLFRNLEYGIYAINSSSTRFVDIRHINFEYNFRGVYLSAMSNADVSFNEFIINTPFVTDGGYGLYLNECTAYTIEENTFEHKTGGPGDPPQPKGVGLIINESGGDANEIYLNYFDNLECGINAQGRNRAKDGTGLQLLCNLYNDNEYDQMVVWESPYIVKEAGIAGNQGANNPQPYAPAGNQFSYTGNGDSDFYNEANKVIYYHHNYLLPPLTPQYYTIGKVIPTPVFGAIYDTTSCPPSTSGGGGTGGEEEARVLLASSGQQVDSVQNIITLLKDGGSTPVLNTEVELSTQPEAYSIYNELMATSPYISDTVMESAIEKEDVFPNVMIRDVMVANPHNAKDDALMEKIEERANPMPEYMKAQVLQGGSLVSVFENLQSRLAFYRFHKNRALNTLVKLYLADSLNPAASTDSLVVLLKSQNNLRAKYILAELYFEQGSWSEGQAVLNNIPLQFNLTPTEAETHFQFTTYYSLLTNMAQQGKPLTGADSLQVIALTQVYNNGAGLPSAYARNILLAMDEVVYNEPIIKADLTKSQQAQDDYNQLIKALNNHQCLNVYPNPAKEFIVVEHQLEQEPINSYIEIKNVKGELMKKWAVPGIKNSQTINIRDYKPGTYIVTLFVDNKLTGSVKFTKVK